MKKLKIMSLVTTMMFCFGIVSQVFAASAISTNSKSNAILQGAYSKPGNWNKYNKKNGNISKENKIDVQGGVNERKQQTVVNEGELKNEKLNTTKNSSSNLYSRIKIDKNTGEKKIVDANVYNGKVVGTKIQDNRYYAEVTHDGKSVNVEVTKEQCEQINDIVSQTVSNKLGSFTGSVTLKFDMDAATTNSNGEIVINKENSDKTQIVSYSTAEKRANSAVASASTRTTISGSSTFVKSVPTGHKNIQGRDTYYLIFQNGDKQFAIEKPFEITQGTLVVTKSKGGGNKFANKPKSGNVTIMGEIDGIPIVSPDSNVNISFKMTKTE